MWIALRAELAYFRPWLLGGLGIATGVSVLLTVLMRLLNEGDEMPGFLPGMFPIIAGMVVAFIAQAYRVEEHRARLLLAGPLTPRQLAVVTVLLPPCLVGLASLGGVVILGIIALLGGGFDRATAPLLAGFAGQFLAYAQLGPLAQEATAARRQGRPRASAAGWTIFVLAIPLLAAFYWFQTPVLIFGQLWHLGVVLVAMAATVALYRGRTDFTT